MLGTVNGCAHQPNGDTATPETMTAKCQRRG